SVPYPWLKAPLPHSYARKTVAAVQGVALTVAVILPHPEALAAVAAALGTLAWSFARDTLWLARQARVGRGVASVADTRPTGAAPRFRQVSVAGLCRRTGLVVGEQGQAGDEGGDLG